MYKKILSKYKSIFLKYKSILWKYKSILWRKNPKGRLLRVLSDSMDLLALFGVYAGIIFFGCWGAKRIKPRALGFHVVRVCLSASLATFCVTLCFSFGLALAFAAFACFSLSLCSLFWTAVHVDLYPGLGLCHL